MTECNAIIEANNEIDKLKRENKKLNALCVQYGFDMGRLKEKNEQLKQRINSRLHFYRELYNSTHDNIVKRVVEDLEDILKGDVE